MESLENGTALKQIVHDGKIINVKPPRRVQPPPSFEELVASPLEVQENAPTQHARIESRWVKLQRWLRAH